MSERRSDDNTGDNRVDRSAETTTVVGISDATNVPELIEPKEESSGGVFSHPAVIAAAVLFVVLALIAAVWWMRREEKTVVAVEAPPTLSSENAEEGEHNDEHSQEGVIEIDDETAELIGIKTEPAAIGTIEDTLSTTGKVLVQPGGQAVVSAKTQGRIVSLTVEPGQTIGRGQTVAVIDSTQIAELRGQLVEARSRLRLAEANRTRTLKTENRAAVIQAKNRLDLATNTLERKKRLAQIGASPGREVMEAETEFKNAKAEYDYQSSIQITREEQEAAGEVEQTKASVSRIARSLAALGASENGQAGTIAISSPISGTVVDRHVSVGETVDAGKEMMTVMNLSSVIVEAQVPESQIGSIGTGQRLIARIPGQGDRVFEGYVQSINNTVNPQTRNVGVRARVSNVGFALKHEMNVEVQLVKQTRQRALMIPASALVDDEGLKIVYVKEGERYERRAVTLGSVTYLWAEVLSGIEEGEEVVTAGAYQLRNMKKGGDEEGGHHDDH